MSEENKGFINAIMRQPLSFAILVLSIVIVVIYLDYRSNVAGRQGSMGVGMAETATAPLPAMMPKPPNLADSGRSQPKIMDNLGANTAAGGNTAPGLEGLIAGLEAKVAANPKDVSKRILLAQTYRELGMTDKALASLQELLKDEPDNARAKLVMASVLSQRDDEKELKQALDILSGLAKVKDDAVHSYLVKMYQGDAYIRLKNHKSALEKWNAALKEMPKQDNRYEMLQRRIENFNSGNVGEIKGTAEVAPKKG